MRDPRLRQGQARGHSLEPVPAHAPVLLAPPPETVEADALAVLQEPVERTPVVRHAEVAVMAAEHAATPAVSSSNRRCVERRSRRASLASRSSIPVRTATHVLSLTICDVEFGKCALVGRGRLRGAEFKRVHVRHNRKLQANRERQACPELPLRTTGSGPPGPTGEADPAGGGAPRTRAGPMRPTRAPLGVGKGRGRSRTGFLVRAGRFRPVAKASHRHRRRSHLF